MSFYIEKGEIPEEDGDIIINMGPHHPATHGVIRMILKTDGEVLREIKPDIGYLHRGIEKIAEGVTYQGFMPWTDRVDYLAAMFCNCVYAMAIEKLLGIEVPKRAEYLRVIACELNRIANHLLYLGVTSMDIGAYTPFLHGLREREYINDFLEELCGARLTYNYARIGGVSFDLPQGLNEKILQFLSNFEPIIDEINRLITYNEIFVRRLANVGIIPKEDAISYGVVGPNLRASGVSFDLRRDVPYSIYPELEFDIPVGKGWFGSVGDSFDRFFLRVEEMRQSAKIIRQCLKKIPDGEIMAKLPKKIKPEEGADAYTRVESARGDLGCYVLSNGGEKPQRVHFRTGSFNSLAVVPKIAKGLMIADLVAFFSTLDIIASETDR